MNENPFLQGISWKVRGYKIDLDRDQTNLVLSNYMIKKIGPDHSFLLKHSGSVQNILDLSKIVYWWFSVTRFDYNGA
jgi:hypothetical protein